MTAQNSIRPTAVEKGQEEIDTVIDLPVQPLSPPGMGLILPDTIDGLRTIAKTSYYPRNRLYPLLADLAEAERAMHVAATRGDAEAKAASEMRQWNIHGAITAEKERASDSGLAMMALALEHRPHEVADLLASALRIPAVRMAITPILADILGPTCDWLRGEAVDHRERIENLEEAVVSFHGAKYEQGAYA